MGHLKDRSECQKVPVTGSHSLNNNDSLIYKGPDRELAYTHLFPLNTTTYHEMPLIEAN